MAGGEANLFLGFAQRGRGGMDILGLRAPAGEAHLPRMVVEVVGALGEDRREPRRVHDDRHQDRGPGKSRKRVAPGIGDVGRVAAGKMRTQSVGRHDLSGMVPNGKKAPSLHTP